MLSGVYGFFLLERRRALAIERFLCRGRVGVAGFLVGVRDLCVWFKGYFVGAKCFCVGAKASMLAEVILCLQFEVLPSLVNSCKRFPNVVER